MMNALRQVKRASHTLIFSSGDKESLGGPPRELGRDDERRVLKLIH